MHFRSCVYSVVMGKVNTRQKNENQNTANTAFNKYTYILRTKDNGK